MVPKYSTILQLFFVSTQRTTIYRLETVENTKKTQIQPPIDKYCFHLGAVFCVHVCLCIYIFFLVRVRGHTISGVAFSFNKTTSNM